MLKTSLMALMAAVPLAAFPSGTGLLPGLYEYMTSTDGAAAEKSRHCVTPAEAEKGLDMPKAGDGCKSVRSTLAEGKIDLLQACKDMTVTAVGTYTATAFVMDGSIQGKLNGQSFKMATHTTAKRVAEACKAGDE